MNPSNKRLGGLLNIISHAASIQGAATWIMENTEWDFMAVYFDSIDHFCHSFMRFYPPRREGIPEEPFHFFKDVVSSGYRFHDMMLERLLKLAGDDVTVMLLSDHGFHSDHLRPNKLPKEPAGPAHEHNPYGVFALAGDHIQKDERVYGATLLDIAPTLLTLFGLPVGKDMDGKPLLQVFDEKIEPEYIDSWETVEGDAGQHSTTLKEDPWAMQEAMRQLVELGYVEDPGDDKKAAAERTTKESLYYLARVKMYRKDFPAAAEILEKIYDESNILRYGLALASCYHSSKKFEDCRRIIDKIKSQNPDEKMVKLDLIEANLLLDEHKHRQALTLLNELLSSSRHMPSLHNQIGKAYTKMFRWDEAKEAYLNALAIDPNNALAHYGLAACFLRKNDYENAAEEALNAIGLTYHFPRAHYVLGEALFYLEEYERAAEAFEVCCSINPGSRKAHYWLVKIYNEKLNEPGKAAVHEKFMEENIKGTITIVSGLPRSGTSMMMQMLAAGGMNILTDEVRKNDDNNPKGYFEYEKTKSLIRDNTWLDEAKGKVVKIVAPLLSGLSNQYHYKIIFMQRDLEEILRSQQIMLGKKSEAQINAYPLALADAFKKQLEKAEAWMKSNANVEVLWVDYKAAIENPAETAEQVCDFLDEELDAEKMIATVDPALYRNKLVTS